MQTKFFETDKNQDYDSLFRKQKEDLRIELNNKLVVPLYHAFCQENKLDFSINVSRFDKKIKLHAKAMSLFNFANPPYHPFDSGLVSFVYTDWGAAPYNFSFEYLSADEVATEMENKDKKIKELERKDKELERKDSVFQVVAFISTLLLLIIMGLRSDSWFPGVMWPFAIFGMFYFFYRINNPSSSKDEKDRVEYEKRLNALKQELLSITE